MTRLLSFAVAAALCGCGFIEDMKGSVEKSEVAAKAIKDKHGWDAQVGGQMLNGKLMVVTVTLNSKQVNEYKVAVLESAVAETVTDVFKAKPEALLLQVVSGQFGKN
jgi:hypothetical protein